MTTIGQRLLDRVITSTIRASIPANFGRKTATENKVKPSSYVQISLADAIVKYGSVSAAARAYGLPRTTFRDAALKK